MLNEITHQYYKNFMKTNPTVEIGDVPIPINKKPPISKLAPATFKPQTTTVWSFPDLGNWPTHKGNYGDNLSPKSPATSSCSALLLRTGCGCSCTGRGSGQGVLPAGAMDLKIYNSCHGISYLCACPNI